MYMTKRNKFYERSSKIWKRKKRQIVWEDFCSFRETDSEMSSSCQKIVLHRITPTKKLQNQPSTFDVNSVNI